MYIVGIGASTGGLSALQELFRSMPAQPGFACVVVMHLSPQHESHLAELLQKCTSMPVTQVTSTVALEVNHVYVIPPNANLNTIDTHLRLSDLEERRIERAPIDHFLRTLAKTHDGTSIGVILTGAGADGSIGLRYISQCGGLTVVQDPREAECDSMPRSAIATGVVDLVVPLRRIAHEILRFCAIHPQLPVPDGNDRIEQREEELLGRLILDLAKKTQQDFDVFRRAKLLARLRRRMQLAHVTTVKDYLEVLRQKKQEAEALADDLLLVPTEFFGDRSAFNELEQHIIPELLDRDDAEGGRLRMWSIGCSTGEEAYSLAMLVTEAAELRQRTVNTQVFASDGSAKSLNAAREGVYPREIAATVSAERLERFFIADRGSFRIKRGIRDLVIFASHNLFRDPPFAHLDLIVCRHLLTDLQPGVRRAVLAMFHYALKPNGLLLLGDCEEPQIPGFESAATGSDCLFRKIPRSVLPRVAAEPTRDLGRDFTEVHQSALDMYAPPSVLINSENTVVHFSTTASQFIRIPGGEPTLDLARLVPEPVAAALRVGIERLRDGSRSWDSNAMTMRTDDGSKHINLHLERVATTGLILVVFEERRPGPPPPSSAETTAADALLRDTTHELHTVLEELATSRQELQAVNEELTTLDRENRRRVRELTQITTDLQHLLAATGVATLFLDRNLEIVRFTPPFGELFDLRGADVGRRVSDLARLVLYQDLETDSRRVLASSQPIDRELLGSDGRWYLSRLLPYLTESSEVQGVVLTLMDVTEQKRAELALLKSNSAKDEFLAVLAHELRNPLAPIVSGIEVLKAAPAQRAIVEKMATTMGRQAQQLVRLVDDLLEVSRISGGKLRLRTSTLDMREIIQDAVAGAHASVERAGHKLTVEVPPEPLWVSGDAARLVQVLSNLLNNAVRYTPAGGKIEVRAMRRDDTVVLQVEDSGIGVPQDLLENIFEMFYQGRNAGGGAGLGIGLTLARTLIELHGGKISATSGGEGNGSRFEIRLPVASAPGDVDPPLTENREPAIFNGDHRILIVDDNTDAAETLCTLLKSLGEREVFTVSSGFQAIKRAPDLHPDIILLDLMMPELDGYEVARRIRREPWGKDLLLVALSGWGQEEHRRLTQEAGFDIHVTKPADLTALRAVLRASTPVRH